MKIDLETFEKTARAKSNMWQAVADDKEASPNAVEAAVSAYTVWSAASHAAAQARMMTQAPDYHTMVLLARDSALWAERAGESLVALHEQLKSLDPREGEVFPDEDRQAMADDTAKVIHALNGTKEADRFLLMTLGFTQGVLVCQPEHRKGTS